MLTLTASAHSVQVQYCVSCNGDLRIWVEHWHGTASPATTTMTISLDINGVVTTVTSAPGGSVINTPAASLPGCSSPLNYVAGCPGEQNTYDDWVYYDFTGLPSNVPITFSILSGNTVFTTDGCGMFPLVVPFTLSTGATDQNICQGQPTAIVPFGPGDTWTNSNPGIGLAAGGVGAIPSFIATGPSGSTATIVFTNSCATDSFVYTINPTPVPGFTVASNGVPTLAVCEGNSFDFTNTSTIPPPGVITDWLWDFGDGTTSALQDPSHTYAAPGTYTVDLMATSDSGCVLNYSQIVTVEPTPVAGFTVAQVCGNIPSTFINTTVLGAGAIGSWQWDFGDGSPISNLQDPVYQYGTIGTYTVQLIVTSATGCVDSISQTTGLYEVPVANFTAVGGCANDPATFTDLSTISAGGLSWNWDYGDMIGTSTAQDGTYLYATSGIYNVQLIVQSANGCFDTLVQAIDMLAEPIADFNFTNDCYYNIAGFTDASSAGINSWEWDFGDGNISTLEDPSHMYLGDGTYTVELIVHLGSCVDTATQVVTRYPQPLADFSVADECLNIAASFTDLSTINAPGAITAWDWDYGDTGTSSVSGPTHIYPSEGVYTINFTAISSFGCTDDTTMTVVIHPIPQPAFTSTSICVNEPPTVFTDGSTIAFGSNVAWDWLFGDGNASSIQSPTNTYAANGDYFAQVTVTSDFGCINSVTNPVIVFEKPLAFFTSDLTKICDSNCIEFTDLSASATSTIVEWDWDFDQGSTVNSQNNTTCYLSKSTGMSYFDVELIATNDLGCKDTMFMADYITVVPQPVAYFTYSPSNPNVLESLVSFTNQSTFSDTYHWDFGDLNSTSSEVHPEHFYGYEGGDYEVTLIAMSIDNGYCQDTITTIITIDEVVLFYVPNSFTPDGDMHNNTFLPILSSGYDPYDYHLSIFNRWGEVIFESYDVQYGWDGTYGGQGLVQDGTYTWTIEFKESMTDQRHSKNGHVTILR
ncbi:MAG: gliding motility-associated-like protein [Flavobacteriaceae bacterium]|jgi:gliding motility-associated-like protein